MKRLELRPWWPELVEAKDRCSLRELSERFGVSPGAINAALKRSGIQRRSARPGPRSNGAAEPSAKGVKGRQSRKSSEQRLAAHERFLGVLSDAQVAKRAGLSVATVARIRRERNIEVAPNLGGRERGGSRIEPYTHLLGTVSDEEVAGLAGVTRSAVRNFRARRKIPSMQERTKVGGEAEAPGVPGEDLGDVLAYQVDLEDGTAGVVLGRNIAQVARLAKSEGIALQRIRLVGPILFRS